MLLVAAETAFHSSTEHVLVRLLLQIVAILVAARVGGALFRRMGQSQAMGEIFSGILLGPTGLGWVAPAAFQALFPSNGPAILPYFSHLGLVLALFLIGAEFDFGGLSSHRRLLVATTAATLFVPILGGLVVGPSLLAAMGGGSPPGAALFIGLTLAITAIPIMGRVLIEEGLTTTRVGVLGIATGALKDLFTWFGLVLLVATLRPPFEFGRVAMTIAGTLSLAVLVLTVGRRGLVALERRFVREGEPLSADVVTAILVLLFLLAAATSALGVFAIFGAFLCGVALSPQRSFARRLGDRLHDLCIWLFLPIFFTYTGLRVDLSSIGGTALPWAFGMAALGTLTSGGVAALCARLVPLVAHEALAFGALINTPGLMVLILLNVGFDLGVLPKNVFSVLVLAAMIRNFVTTPVLRWSRARGLP